MMKPKENTRPAASVEVLETVRREFRFPMRDKWESQPNMFGMAAAEERTLVTRQNAEEVIAAKDARIAELEARLETANALVTCCCGTMVNDHGMGSGHNPVDQYHYAMDQLESDNKRLREALGAMLIPFEDSNCRHDHHGYCQEHFLEENCCVAKARAALGEM